MSGHEARTRQDCPRRRRQGARRSCRERRWRLVRSRGLPGSPERPQESGEANQATLGGAVHVRFRSRPRLHVPGKVHITSAAGHLPSVRGRLVGRLHDAWSSPVPERLLTCALERDSAVRQRGHPRHHRRPRPGKGTSVGGPPGPVPSLLVTGCGSVAATLMPDQAPSPDPG